MCDQPLVTWVHWAIAISIAGIVVELLKITMGANTLTSYSMILIGVCPAVVWVWGHWPVPKSDL